MTTSSGSSRLAVAQLTPAQRSAVEHVEGPMLILAGPGSGKTRVVTHRIAHLLQEGVRGSQILALTFTNKAAEEMQRRVAQLVPEASVWVSTFHRFCSRLLRQHAALVGLEENFSIYDDGESRQTMNLAAQEVGIDLSFVTPDKLASGVSWAKRQLITPEQYTPRPGNPTGSVVAKVYPVYQRRMLAANAVDFDDLLMHVGIMLRENPELRETLDERLRFILVDEYQDTNLAQYAIVRGLSINHPNLAVTGDPDQCIYCWRGANLSNILDFERDFPHVKVVRLEQNYRSTPNILRVADHLIAHNIRRKEKRLLTTKPSGDPVRLVVYATSKDEAEDIADQVVSRLSEGRRPRDFAVFYRTNALSRMLEEAFLRRGVPYQIVSGQEFYQRREVKDVLAYLHLLNNARHDAALRRVINTPARGIGKTTLSHVDEHARRHNISLLEAARQADRIPSLKKRAATALAKFIGMYDALRESARDSVAEIAARVLDQSGYRHHLTASQSEEDQDRLANVDELLVAAREFDTLHPDGGGLEAFLEQAALVADSDNWEQADDKVSLMTLHAAKGLEFPVVFLVAVEEGLLPHERSRYNEEQLEEERRLLFVGITRAESELQLSMARRRAMRGDTRPTVPSTFLMELPREELELIEHEAEIGSTWRGARSLRDRWSQAPDEGWAPDSGDDWDEPAFDVSDDSDSLVRPASAVGSEDVFDDVFDDLPHDVLEDGLDEGPESLPPARPKSRHKRSPGQAAQRIPAALKTAAELLGDADSLEGGGVPRRIDAESFDMGMLVMHPQYGPGKIVALGGSASKRMATVQFFGPGGRKTFRLAFSPLQPLASSN